MNDADPEIPQAWVRALLPTAILACLTSAPLHGYGIAQRLGELGLGTPKGGSLYPVLAKLEAAGEVETTWVEGDAGPGRKEYTITANGLARLATDRAAFTRLHDALRIASTTPSPTTTTGESR